MEAPVGRLQITRPLNTRIDHGLPYPIRFCCNVRHPPTERLGRDVVEIGRLPPAGFAVVEHYTAPNTHTGLTLRFAKRFAIFAECLSLFSRLERVEECDAKIQSSQVNLWLRLEATTASLFGRIPAGFGGLFSLNRHRLLEERVRLCP